MVERSVGPETLAELRRRGHEVEEAEEWKIGRLTAAKREQCGLLTAAATPRLMQAYAIGRQRAGGGECHDLFHRRPPRAEPPPRRSRAHPLLRRRLPRPAAACPRRRPRHPRLLPPPHRPRGPPAPSP